MTTASNGFTIATAENLQVSDTELTALLTEVYVGGSFTTADEAATLFAPAAVRGRGILLAARDNRLSTLAGMAIVVPPGSAARRLARHNEAELHLLAVRPDYRCHGLGRRLVETAVELAGPLGCRKIMLWTQESMTTAQHLYESSGFRHISDFERNGRRFKVYERSLQDAHSTYVD